MRRGLLVDMIAAINSARFLFIAFSGREDTPTETRRAYSNLYAQFSTVQAEAENILKGGQK